MIDDDLDRQILRLLQKNGKLTYEEISKKVNEERIGMMADAYVSADVPQEKTSEAFAHLFSMENVSEILRITGERRVMFRIRSTSNAELISLIDRNIRPLGFENIEIKIILDHLLRYPGL
jgi:Lrp/AsnC family leucine-responsive transcriptional regulator